MTTPLPILIRKSQPIWLPLSLLFLVFTVASGPSSGFWWIRLKTGQFGDLRIGALGICDSRGCSKNGLGFNIGNNALGDVLLSIPGFLVFHLIVIILAIILYIVNLAFLWQLHAIVGQYRKTGWLFFLNPLLVNCLYLILIMGDAIILKGLGEEEGIEKVVPGGSFWMTIPAFLFSLIWTALSYDLYCLSRLSINPNEQLKRARIEAENDARRQGVPKEPTTSAYGLFKPAQPRSVVQSEDKPAATLGGWGLSNLGWGGAEKEESSAVYGEEKAASSFIGLMWGGRNAV